MKRAANLILVRHGESVWNRDNRFTGWADVDLSDEGISQMHEVGRALREAEVVVNVAFTSLLKRCIRSQWILLDQLDRMWVPQTLDWRLNERHYGALTGMSKMAAVETFGEAAVHRWRRSFKAIPPCSNVDAPVGMPMDARYEALDPERIPRGESLEQTVQRVTVAWRQRIAPRIEEGKQALVVGHGNALRALTRIIEDLSDEATSHLEILNAAPVLYSISTDMGVRDKQHLTVPARRFSEIL